MPGQTRPVDVIETGIAIWSMKKPQHECQEKWPNFVPGQTDGIGKKVKLAIEVEQEIAAN